MELKDVFFKSLGEGLGSLSGEILGGAIKKVGEVTDSRFIQEVGTGVNHSMQYTGNLLGNLADGAVNVGVGIINKDDEKIEQGFGEIGNNVTDFGKRALHSVGTVLVESDKAIEAFSQGDYETAKRSGEMLAKMAAVGALSVGVIEVVDGIDVSQTVTDVSNTSNVSGDLNAHNDYMQIENYNTHEVSPHFRELPNGQIIWVDGDGDTSVDRDTGWTQTNPNYRIPTV